MTETKPDNPATNPTPATAPQPSAKPAKSGADKVTYYWGTGRRKSSVARVRIKAGSGKLLVNKKDLNDYFKREQDRSAVLSPLKTVNAEKSFDVFINVNGGGTTGQAGASQLGIARALKTYDGTYLQALRDGGHLTRDSRMVERKKPGQSGARKRYQFSKR
ncbi:MAG: 30S ribosomal protein S9 [Planctomycetota bacterium]|jgi:small subunit ribosomal protein S9|nr:30S ribosomal protein S9 [Planctomycetota bacterium]